MSIYRIVQTKTNDVRDSAALLEMSSYSPPECKDCKIARVVGRERAGYLTNPSWMHGRHVVRYPVYWDVEPCKRHIPYYEKFADFKIED